jgi:amino acid transporter, AAT family
MIQEEINMSSKQGQELHRGLEERHINLMSLGAAIGVGLFLGSATAIKMAGPGIIVGYGIAGIIMFFIMRALGEMAINKPVAGSFSAYAREYISPLTGYLTGWNYWFLWIVTCMAEITAVGVYMKYWFPGSAGWAWALAALVVMTTVNFLAVKLYGELEFWFALIKIVTICAMIVVGLGTIIFGLGHGGVATGISNLWSHGGIFPHGLKGVLMALQMVMFAYLGIEMIGVTAGEVKNPEKTLARAVDSVFYRILIFYVGALFVIMSIYPWQEIGTKGSPFVLTFSQVGIHGAAGIINFVVLTAALSSCNSGIFSTGRMLFDLAINGEAPKSLGNVSKSGVPGIAIIASAIVLLLGVALNYFLPAKVFTMVTSIGTFTAIWTWGVILIAQLRNRKNMSPEQRKGLKYKLPLYPLSSYISLAFLVLVLVVMAINPDQRIAVIVGPIFILLLVAIYYIKGFNKRDALNSSNKKQAS